MKVKKILLCGIACMLVMAMPFGSMSCSDDDGVEHNASEDTMRMVQKVFEIVGRSTKGPQVVKEAKELAVLNYLNYFNGMEGSIGVAPGRLNGEDITLISLGGEEKKPGQATTSQESTLAAFGQPNDYLTAVTNLFENGTIPQEKPVVVTGVCLGGMIAQQVLGQRSVMDKFKIKAVITFGTGVILPLDRQAVKVVRFIDANDPVPAMAESILRTGQIKEVELTTAEIAVKMDEMNKKEAILRSGKYVTALETHMLSYIDDDCWLGTDFMGDSEKKNVLELTDSIRYHMVPIVTPHLNN